MKRVDFSEYQDRGMKKWQGFFLSEHNTALANLEKKEYKFNAAKVQMDEHEINQVIEQALLRRSPVRIQTNEVDLDGNHADDVVGHLRGYDEDGIYIGSEIVELELIRHIELEDMVKWSTL